MKINLYILLSILFLSGCENNLVPDNTSEQVLLFERAGLIDSVVGTCSAYQVRTTDFDTIDSRNYSGIKFELTAGTDGDLSNVNFFLNGVNNLDLVMLNGLDSINNLRSITIPSPNVKQKLSMRLRLFASVCTGQNFHLKVRDFRVYGILKK